MVFPGCDRLWRASFTSCSSGEESVRKNVVGIVFDNIPYFPSSSLLRSLGGRWDRARIDGDCFMFREGPMIRHDPRREAKISRQIKYLMIVLTIADVIVFVLELFNGQIL